MRQHILLIVPPFPERTYQGRTMGVEYLVSGLAGSDTVAEVFDCDIFGIELLKEKLIDFSPDIIGITNMSFQADEANDIAGICRKLIPTALIIKGGSHETSGGYESSLLYHAECVDIAVLGEGEEALREIISYWRRGTFKSNLENISGIAYRAGEKIVRTPLRNGPPRLDSNIPQRSHHHQRYDFDIFDGRKTAQVMTTRGCNQKCYYCDESTASSGVRRRSEESIRAELDILKRDGYEAIYFDNSTFTDDFDHAILVCNLMHEYGFIWGCNTRVDALTREIVMQMAGCGCVYVFCGVESFVPEVLRGLNKTLTPDLYIHLAKQSYRWFEEAGIPRSVFLIFGGPKVTGHNGQVTCDVESWDDIRQTIYHSLYDLNPDYLSMNVLRLLPDLPLSYGRRYEYLRPHGYEIHAGFYDALWLTEHKMPDIRSRHEIYNAFEGRCSINPQHMTVERCYEILSLAVDMINEYYQTTNKLVKIVVGDDFEQKYLERTQHGYRLAPLSEMIELERFHFDYSSNSR